MKITGYVRFKWLPEKGVAWIKPNPQDAILFQKLSERKQSRENKGNQEILVQVSVDLQYEKRTFKQLRTAWKLVEIIFETQDGRKPTDEERYDLYTDCLYEFADKVPSRMNPNNLRPVHLSESNTFQAAKFIQGMFDYLAESIDMPDYLQADVRDLFWEYEAWRGGLEVDPLDYQDEECTQKATREKWWKYHRVSDASGTGGILQLAHIVSRGSDAADIEEPWNWLALSPEQHHEQHQYGWDYFLNKWPHLRGRVERARLLAGKLSLESKVG